MIQVDTLTIRSVGGLGDEQDTTAHSGELPVVAKHRQNWQQVSHAGPRRGDCQPDRVGQQMLIGLVRVALVVGGLALNVWYAVHWFNKGY